MSSFRALAMVRHPVPAVWGAVRDRLPELVPYLDDIEAVTVESRQENGDGLLLLVNVWKARPPLPPALAARLRPDMLAWTDRARWQDASGECQWTIEPHFASESVSCSGTTRFEPAMGGRGTRLTFEGTIEVRRTGWVGVLAPAVESFVATLIPGNFQKLARAADTLLSRG